MDVALDFGGSGDPLALKLETRKGRWIRNVPRPEQQPSLIASRMKALLGRFPNATPLSASTAYNCFGLAFASRRTAIVDETDVEGILEDDGYRRRAWCPLDWRPGDVVVYRDGAGRLAHLGLVAAIEAPPSDGRSLVFVASAWGDLGEYLHRIDEVPGPFGRASDVVSQRYVYDLT